MDSKHLDTTGAAENGNRPVLVSDGVTFADMAIAAFQAAHPNAQPDCGPSG
jgi:hypothetical protein